MEKFDSKKHLQIQKAAPFMYSTCAPYLDLYAYIFTRNEESILVWKDTEYPHEFPSIFTPRDKRNWEHAIVYYATPEEVEKTKAEGIELVRHQQTDNEFYYETATFIDPKGKLAKRAKAFIKKYPTLEVKSTCTRERLLAFYQEWLEGRTATPGMKSDREFFDFCIDNFDTYGIKQVYLEDKGKLVGFAWGVAFDDHHWVGLHLKTLAAYRDAGRFLNYERAKLFATHTTFTLGGDCNDKGICKFKQELGPSYVKTYVSIKTGSRKQPGPSTKG